MHNEPAPDRCPCNPADRRSARRSTASSQVVVDGLRHGHFRCAISSGIGKGNRRELVIEAGKSHKFTIPEDEVPR